MKPLIYSVDHVNGKYRLHSEGILEQLYLICGSLAQKHYSEALYTIEKLNCLRAFTKEETEMIHKIFRFITDKHPQSVVILIKLAILVEQNHLKYYTHQSEKETIESSQLLDLGSIYASYLKNSPNARTCRLTDDEEKDFINLLNQRKLKEEKKKNNFVFEELSIAVRETQYSIAIPNLAHMLKLARMPKIPELPSGASLNAVGRGTFFKLFSSERRSSEQYQFACVSTNDFEDSFAKFYQIARHGTQEERKITKEKLTILHETSNFDDSELQLIKFLFSVFENPKKYPTVDRIVSTTEDNEYKIWNEEIRSVYEKLHRFAFITNTFKFIGEIFQPKKVFEAAKNYYFLANVKKIHEKSTAATDQVPLTGKLIQQDGVYRDPFTQLKDNYFDATLVPADEPITVQSSSNDESIQEYVNNVRKNMSEFYANRPKESVKYEIKGSSEHLLSKVNEYIKKQKVELKEKREKIVAFANQFPTEKGNLNDLKQLGLSKRKLKFSDVIDLFEEGDFLFYQEKTFLTKDQVKTLEEAVADYLLQSTRTHQAMRVKQYNKKLSEAKSGSTEYELYIQKIGSELATDRSYLTSDNSVMVRSMLVFEYRNELILRKKQVDMIESILKMPNPYQLFAQLGTGSGKSKVIAPLIQWLQRKTKRNIINLWPSSLASVNSNDTKRQIQSSFHQQSNVFQYCRNSSTELADLQFIRKELEKALKDKHQLNSRPEDLQSFELKFLEMLFNELNNTAKISEASFSEAQKILQLLQDVEGHIDEGHVNLSSRREVNFTIGSGIHVSEGVTSIIESLYRYLISDPYFTKKLKLKENKTHMVSDETLKNSILPKIADFFVVKLGIPAEKNQEFKDYVLGKGNSIPQWIVDSPIKDKIAMVRGELNFLLPETLKKCVNVHFGVSHEPEKRGEQAKPYDASDSPVENADYDNIHEAFNKTYQTYIHQRLTLDQHWSIVQQLQGEVIKEAERKKIDPKETSTYRYVQEKLPQPLHNLFGLNIGLLEQHLTELNNSDELIFFYVGKFIIPAMKKYTKKLRSDAQNLRSMLGSQMAMTATPGNVKVYGSDMAYRHDTGNTEQVLHTLTKKCSSKDSIKIIDAGNPREILSNIIKDLLSNGVKYRMLIDIGAQFKGISSQEIAKALLQNFSKRQSEIKGVVFFQGDKLMILEKNRKEPIPLEQSHLTKDERFAYCDNKHMFGADIPLPPDSRGLATFDIYNDKDDQEQGVGRMRELMQGQSIEWIVTNDIKNMISNSEELTFQKLLDIAIGNQVVREQNDLYRGLKQQMRNEIRQVMMKKLIHASSLHEAKRLFESFMKLLVDDVPLDPFILYGQIEKEVLTVDNLCTYCDSKINAVKQISQFSKAEKKDIINRLESYKKMIEEWKKQLPKSVKERTAEVGVEAEIQQETEMNTEIDTNTHVEFNAGNQLRTETPWNDGLNLFQGDWFKSSDVPVLRVKMVADKVFDGIKDLFNLCIKPSEYLMKNRFSVVKVAGVALSSTILLVASPIFITLGALWLSLRVIDYAGRFRRYSIAKQLIYRADDVVKNMKARLLNKTHHFFNNGPNHQLLMTNNFINLNPVGMFESPVQPLSHEQKNLHEVLVIEDELPNGKKKLTVIMGDQSTDARFWRKKLEKDSEETDVQNRKRKIALYDLNLGIVVEGKNQFDEKSLEKNRLFRELIVKAKIYNGSTKFTLREEKTLRRLLKNYKDRDSVFEFYKHAMKEDEEKLKELGKDAVTYAIRKTQVN